MLDLTEQFSQLPEYLGWHIRITLFALLVGLAISFPIAIISLRYARLRWLLLSAASVVQTIPSLALLALMVPLLSTFGFWPAVSALILYSMLPILRNTITGIEGVDPAVVEAARGIGMTPHQIRWLVQIPLAIPVIMAGIRTGAVWVVGIATLSTPVGQPSLGNYIFSGLQTRDWTTVIFGCIAAAILALIIDSLLAGLQHATDRRSRTGILSTLTGLVLLALVGIFLPGIGMPDNNANGPTYTIGAKTFTEQYLLAEMLEEYITDAGYNATKRESLGSSIVFDALRQNEVDIYVDYTGTIWTNYMKHDRILNADQTFQQVRDWLLEEHGIVCIGPLGFENTYALAMRSDHASSLNINTIEDLAAHTSSLEIGSDYEFYNRPEWTRLRDLYNLQFARELSFDSTFMYQAVKEAEVDVITAFSSDGRIRAYNLKVLKDTKQAFPPYDAVLLVSPQAAKNKKLLARLRQLKGKITLPIMQQANQQVDIEGESIPSAGQWLLNHIQNP